MTNMNKRKIDDAVGASLAHILLNGITVPEGLEYIVFLDELILALSKIRANAIKELDTTRLSQGDLVEYLKNKDD